MLTGFVWGLYGVCMGFVWAASNFVWVGKDEKYHHHRTIVEEENYVFFSFHNLQLSLCTAYNIIKVFCEEDDDNDK